MNDLSALIGLIGALSGIALGWLARSRSIRSEDKKEAANLATIQADLSHIKRGIDDIKSEMRVQDVDIDCLSERITRVEEGEKSNRKRIDKLEELTAKN